MRRLSNFPDIFAIITRRNSGKDTHRSDSKAIKQNLSTHVVLIAGPRIPRHFCGDLTWFEPENVGWTTTLHGAFPPSSKAAGEVGRKGKLRKKSAAGGGRPERCIRGVQFGGTPLLRATPESQPVGFGPRVPLIADGIPFFFPIPSSISPTPYVA